MAETTTFPCLYVLVNTDLESMNPGKMAAHSGHSANAFVERAIVAPLLDGKTPDPLAMSWRAETPQGFGTQINLKVPARAFEALVALAKAAGFIAETVYDPTYPYFVSKEIYKLLPEAVHTAPPVFKGNEVICFRREMTGAYVFGDKNSALMSAFISQFPLHD